MIYEKTIEAQTQSGALFRIDSYKYKILSVKRIGQKKVGNRNFYKYKVRYTER